MRLRSGSTLVVLAAAWLGLSNPCAYGQVREPDPPHLLEGPTAPDPPGNAFGRKWQVQKIDMPERPFRILTTGALAWLGDVRIETASGAWFAVGDCPSGLCATLVEAPHGGETLPQGALPGSHMALGDGRIARAWLADPAQRLDSNVVGPSVAGTLVVEDQTTKAYRLELGLDQAFEDLRPRIADLDGDGQGTVFVVRSSIEQGAALVAVRLEGEGLLRIAGETPPAGYPGGWINPVGLADFTGQGRSSIALVSSPDQGGRLLIYDFDGRNFSRRFAIPGVSNHIPGKPIQDMAVIADFNGDSIADIAVPDASRKNIRILTFAGAKVAEPAGIALPAAVATDIAGIRPAAGERPMLLMGLDDGELVLLH